MIALDPVTMIAPMTILMVLNAPQATAAQSDMAGPFNSEGKKERGGAQERTFISMRLTD